MNLKRWLAAKILILLFFAMPAMAQNKVVTGKVTDARDGSAIQGVTVTVKGTKGAATQTAADGTFKIKVTDGASTLVLTSIGFGTKEVEVGDGNVVASLSQSNSNLGDVVVVGYGSTRKKDLTGAVASVGSKDFNQGAITSPLQQIAGKTPGVVINVVGSEPGNTPVVRIRGITSLSGGNEPLVVIDGVQGSVGLLSQIPPAEIETFDILKDASATAIYGSRGAPGVILVTTKKGKAGALVVDYNGVASFESISKKYDVLSAQEWRSFISKNNIANANDYGANTDWVKAVTRNGFTHTHNIGFGAGNETSNYRASLTAISQDGLIINSANKNYVGRIQLNQKGLDNRLSVQLVLNASTIESKYNNADNVFNNAYTARPTDPIYFKKSNGQDSTAYFVDPKAVFSYTNIYAKAKEIIDQRKLNTIFGTFKVDLDIYRGISAGVFGSWNKSDNDYSYYNGRKTTDPGIYVGSLAGIATKKSQIENNKQFNFNLTYKKVIGKHNLNILGLYEYQNTIKEGYGLTGKGFINDILTYNQINSASVITSSDNYKDERILVSFLGRLNYTFNNKYFFTASVRRDGSSVFGDNNKWGTFKAASFAWKLSQEDFMKNQSFFSDLKIRIGYGGTGNQQGLDPQKSKALVQSTGTSVYYGGVLIPAFGVYQNPNPDLKWETKEGYNLGIDFEILKGKLSGNFDVYSSKTNNLLWTFTVPSPPLAVPYIFANGGSLSSKGIELALNYNAYRSKDWTVSFSGNISTNTSKVINIGGVLPSTGTILTSGIVGWGGGDPNGISGGQNASYLINNKPIGTFLVFKHIGVDAYGNEVLDNLSKTGSTNGVGSTSATDPNRYEAGNVQPKFTYGFAANVSYKRFDLNLFFRGVSGNKIYNLKRAQLNSTSKIAAGNILREAVTNKISTVNYLSDFFLESGSFLRLDNATFSYRLNTASVKYISNLKVFVTGNNLFIITKYKGIDPELSTSGEGGSGIDYGIYPKTRSIAVGVNVSFK